MPSTTQTALGMLMATLMGLSSWSLLGKKDSSPLGDLSPSNGVSNDLLLAFRSFMALLGSGTLWSSIRGPGVIVSPKYVTGSKLKARSLQLKGLGRLTTFTTWCWTLISLYFLLVTALTLLQSRGVAVTTSLLRLVAVLYQICASTSVLVTLVVTYALVPMNRKASIPNPTLTSWRGLLYHNGNVTSMLFEGVLGSMTFALSDFPFVVLFGCAYVVFAWWWFSRVHVYYYFFLDHTLPVAKAVGFHLGLVVVLTMFFLLGAWLSRLSQGVSIVAQLGVVGLGLLASVDFRGIKECIWG